MLVLDKPDAVHAWTARQLDMSIDSFKPVAWANGVESKGHLIAGVIYHELRFEKFGTDIRISMAATNPRWATKRNIGVLLGYPFYRFGCGRVTLLIARENERARRFVEGIGFVPEGCARRGYDGRSDAMIYGILREEVARWTGEQHGQKFAFAAGRA
jgi:RimJ/RimL family protein N-acetyltransferase